MVGFVYPVPHHSETISYAAVMHPLKHPIRLLLSNHSIFHGICKSLLMNLVHKVRQIFLLDAIIESDLNHCLARGELIFHLCFSKTEFRGL